MTKPKYWKQAKIFLSKKDKVLKKLILKYKGSLKTRKDPFFSLCKSIVGQQISVQAANSVWKKLENKSKKITPKNISKLNNRQLASCGLSRQKILYLKILSKKFITKGDKVKFTVKFKGREMQHTNLGKELMNKIIEETKDIAKVESQPKFEGKQMVMIIQPI